MKYKGGIISSIVANVTSTIASAVWSLQDQMQGAFGINWPGVTAPALYAFTDATIAPTIASGISGRTGPSLAQLVTATTSTGDVSWKNNTSYFNATSGIISWTVPATGTYRFEVWGARGGGGGYSGGYGARMRGDFALTAGSVIKILIGQTGGNSYGGGGGGTFVATDANVPLIVAGGGNTTSPWSSTSVNAVTTTSGTSGSVAYGGTAGGGGNATAGAAGGAGFTGNGTNTSCGSSIAPLSFVNGGTGGQTCNSIGGFGGGSASDGCCNGASGAGGGYSGGAGTSGGSQYGGAGGSYNDGTNPSNDAGGVGTATRSDNGQIIITRL
jgi:hypothetical protein